MTKQRNLTCRVSRFTISVPAELLEAVDQQLIKGDETRSALIRHLLEAALREAEEREDVERYVRGYREQPQTEEELGWSDSAGLQHLAELPWKPRK
jgi:metal-responsive CopG/Arc/MetJ family transcriptional regulator